MEIKWTDDQRKIIDSRDKNILVSASAGSGKTTVMIQRIIELMLDEKNRTPISNFLVVTFTKASAIDMKKKLVEALSKKQDDEFCLEQIDAVETSDISNLHSFCSRIISTYFYDVNIDPSFQVLDDNVAEFLKEKALKELFEKKEKTGDVDYFKLFDIFQKKRKNENLKYIIKKFNNFLNSNINSEKWFFDTIEKIYNTNLEENDCAKLINNYVSNQIADLVVEIEQFALKCKKFGLENVCDYFYSVGDAIKVVNKNNPFEVNVKNVFEIKLPSSPRVSALVELKPQIDDMKSTIKKQIENFQKNFVCDDVEFLKQGLSDMKNCALSLYNLVNDFNEIYDGLKKEVNGLDFNDLEKYTLKILKNPEILQTIKEKYKYVFVDEYQDINSVQEEIISLVSGENNRFMVGDIKQSIYRFRLCDPDIFMAKYNAYEKGQKVSELFKLNCNFRSDKKILKFVDDIFSGVMTKDFGGIDYKKDSVFVAGQDNLDNPKSVNLCLIDIAKTEKEKDVVCGVYSVKNHVQSELDDEEKGALEAKVVANKIIEISNEVGKDFKYSDCAVLVGSRNAMVSKFIETLKNYRIPVAGDESYNLVDRVYIQEILNFVKVCCNQDNDYNIFKVLKSRLFGFDDNELVQIRLTDKKARFFECVKNESLVGEDLQQKLHNFNDKIKKFSMFAKVLTVKQLCKKIVDEFSLREINDASEFYEIANNDIDLMIESLPETSAFDFVLNYNNFSLSVENECGGDKVSVMTIHKSKGLEFKYVFLINTTNEFNFESTFENVIFNKDLGVGIDYFDVVNRTQIETIASSGIKLLEKRKLVEEQQRVLYVALTRAKEKLFVIGTKEVNKISDRVKAHKKCYFDWFEKIIYNELYDKHNVNINFEIYKASELAEKTEKNIKTLLLKENDSEVEPEWVSYKYDDSQKFALKTSVSKILSKSHSEMVVGTGSSAERGTNYHAVFEKLDFKNLESIDNQIDLILKEKGFENIDKNIVKNIVKLPLFEELSKANNILTEREFFAKLSTDLIEKSNAESEFILQGVIDLVAVFDDGIIILDYKTGKMNNEKLKDYEFQLSTYAMIASKIFDKKVLKKVLCLIDEQKIIEI